MMRARRMILKRAYTCNQTASMYSLPRCDEVSTQGPLLSALDKRRLIFQDGESLLQSVNLSFPACLSLLVCLWLGNAPVLNFTVIVHYCAEFGVGGLAVCRHSRDVLVQAIELLCLVLDVLLLHSLGNLVFLCDLLVLSFSIVLLGGGSCEVFRKV